MDPGKAVRDPWAYARVRHPIYLGIMLLLWGLAWGMSNPGVGFLTLGISFLYFERKSVVEERWMSQRFAGYLAYRERVPKLLPGRTRPGA